jgi:hypothetical protein
MAQTITINVDDGGRITVDAEENGQPMGDQYECDTPEECLQFVESVMTEEEGENPEEQMTEGPEDYKKMWNEEAKKRPSNPNMME